MSEETNITSQSQDESESKKSGEESFAELFEKNIQLPERLRPGQKTTARIVSITSDLAFVDLGGKSEGAIDIDEFRDENGNITVSEGQEVEAFFVKTVDGLMRMTTLIHGNSITALNTIKEAMESGSPVEGTVEKEVKGGYAVRVNGVRCFCPASQMDLKISGNGNRYINQTFTFRVLEFRKEGQNIVISRRAILEEERRAAIEKLKESLHEGDELTVRISSIRKFGAFADIGGIDALIPVSEMSWGRVEDPADIVSEGDEVKVKVLSLDWESERISLSIKATQPDPWTGVAEKYPEGSKINGTIVRLAPFGAFVAVEPGLDGLIHISNLGTGRRINHPKEVVKVGQTVDAYVLAVDGENRKLSLSLQPRPEPKKIEYPKVGTLIEGTVENVMPYGVFVKISDDLTGLVPNNEMGTKKGSDHTSMFPPGTPMKVVVLDVDADNGRVRLSRRAVEEKEAKEEFDRYRETVRQSSTGLGNLGELLKAKMKEKNIQF